MVERLVIRISRLSNWQIAIIIAAIGIVVCFSSLNNAFQGDDLTQIIENTVVHSISHLKLFFEGGTFYNNEKGTVVNSSSTLNPLTGIYYRPLMTVAFSLVYTLFGVHQFYYHLLQLLLCIGSSILLYLFFRYSFGKSLSLVLALVFLLHPIDSQVLYAIPSMQDALFFFFGILAMWLLLRFNSVRSLSIVAVCLLMSLLSKEAGGLFVVMALIYLSWFDRKRLFAFVGIIAPLVVLYFLLKIHAVGLINKPEIAPIDKVGLADRIITIPSILLFYITKFIFPVKLASGYYWVYKSFSVQHVLLPSLIDIIVLALLIYGASIVRRQLTRAQYYTYLFFATWAGLGLLVYLQVLPLDMTACETWFYFPIAGVLGMLGVLLQASNMKMRPEVGFVVAVLIIGCLGIRTELRGFDWQDGYVLANHDVAASKEDYIAYNVIADNLIYQGKFDEAKTNLSKSISNFPSWNNYNLLGLVQTNQFNYDEAEYAYNESLNYGVSSVVCENLGALALVHGTYFANKTFILNALHVYPQDPALWMYLAILEDGNNDNTDAKVSIVTAEKYARVPQFVYDSIMQNQSFLFSVPSFRIKVLVHNSTSS